MNSLRLVHIYVFKGTKQHIFGPMQHKLYETIHNFISLKHTLNVATNGTNLVVSISFYIMKYDSNFWRSDKNYSMNVKIDA